MTDWLNSELGSGSNPGDQSTSNKRRLEFHILESHYYECHRAHSKRERLPKPGDDTVDRRAIVRPSKKINCKARLIVRLYTETPDIAYMKKVKDHNAHTPGDAEDIEHIMTTKNVREKIMHMLRNGHGITRRQIRMQCNKDALMLPIQHVDAQIRTEAIGHVYRMWSNERTQKDKDDTVSVTRWLVFIIRTGYGRSEPNPNRNFRSGSHNHIYGQISDPIRGAPDPMI